MQRVTRVILALAAIVLLSGGSVMAELSESPELAAQRQEMKHRQRRLIYNNDSGDIYVAGADTPDGFLAVRMKPVLNTQVDSVFYCTGATTMFSHQAKVGEVYGKHIPEGAKGFPAHIKGNIEALAELGTDALALVVKFCHENHLEVFFTHRINDIHDSMDSCSFELSTWKREHPEYCLGKREDRDKYDLNDPRYWWSSLDFQIDAVREYLLAIIDDVLGRYDVDGIEIDYFRHPVFFRPNLTYKPASRNQVKILTGFQRGVRELAYAYGNRRGRPILVATRVPMTKAICRHVGIDIEGWLRQDLLDILTPEVGYAPFTMPTRELVDLAHAYNVPVYPTISGAPRRGYGSIEAWRGVASNIHHAGADGIYLFNTFPRKPKHPHFTQLGDPKTLAHMNKLFAIDNRPVLLGCVAQAIVQSEILPKELDSSGKARQVDLPAGDDIAAAAKAGRLSSAELRVQFIDKTPDDKVELRLNDEVIEPGEEKEGWVTYHPEPRRYRQGDNAIAFRVTARGAAREKPIVVQSVELHVHYD